MSSSIYALLNFSTDSVYTSAVSPLSANVMMQMNNMPSLINSWQQEDIANQDTGDYYQNPTQLAITTAK